MDIVKGQPFHVAADHGGVDTSTYSLLVNGAAVDSQPVSALQNGQIAFSNVIVTTVGEQTVAVAAVGPGGTATSAVLPFTVVVVSASPAPPTNIRLTIV